MEPLKYPLNAVMSTTQMVKLRLNSLGLRPGEKLYEELLIGSDSKPSAHKRILQANESFIPLAQLDAKVHSLLDASKHNQTSQALEQLKALVPEFQHKQ